MPVCPEVVFAASVPVAIVGRVAHDYHLDIPLQLRWGDMDPNNHVNNVQFARLFEETRVRSFADWWPTRPADLSMLVARQDIEFSASLEYTPAPICARSCVSRVGTSSFVMALRLFDDHEVLCASAETTMVVVDPDTGRPRPIPPDMRDVLEYHLGEPIRFHARRSMTGA